MLILIAMISINTYAQEQVIKADEWLSWKHDGLNTAGEIATLRNFEVWTLYLDEEGAEPIKRFETVPAPHNVEPEIYRLVINNIFFGVAESGRYQIIIKVYDRSGFSSAPHDPFVVVWSPSFPTPVTDIAVGPQQ